MLGEEPSHLTALLSEVFSQPQQKCLGVALKAELHHCHSPTEGMDISLREAVCTAQKGWEGQPDTGQRGQARTRQYGGRCTKEEKSHYLHAKAGEQQSSLTAIPPARYTEKEE